MNPAGSQHALKPASGAARAGILAAELFDQLLVPVDDAVAALHLDVGAKPLRRLLIVSRENSCFLRATTASQFAKGGRGWSALRLGSRSRRPRLLLVHPRQSRDQELVDAATVHVDDFEAVAAELQ